MKILLIDETREDRVIGGIYNLEDLYDEKAKDWKLDMAIAFSTLLRDIPEKLILEAKREKNE